MNACIIFKGTTGSYVIRRVYILKLQEELRQKYAAKEPESNQPWTTPEASILSVNCLDGK